MKATAPAPNTYRGAGAEERRRRSRPKGRASPPHRCLPRRRTRARARRRAGSEGTRATLAPFLMASAPPSDQPPPLPANDGRKRQQGGRSEPAATGAQPFAPRPRRHLRQRGQAGGQGAKARRARERMPRAARTPMCGEAGNAAAATTSAAAGASPPIGASVIHHRFRRCQPAVAESPRRGLERTPYHTFFRVEVCEVFHNVLRVRFLERAAQLREFFGRTRRVAAGMLAAVVILAFMVKPSFR